MASQRLARLFPQGDGSPGRFWVDRGTRLPGRGDFPVKLQHLFDSHAHYEDALFGEDARREIFGETVNLRECLSAFGALVQGASAQRDEVTQLMAQYAPQRVARA